MPRLKDRNKQTPGGHQFYDPVLKYRARPWASVDEIAAGLIQARLGNPALTQQNGWSTDETNVRNEVDAAIARHCQQMNWTQYIVADAPGGVAASIPFPHRPQNQRFLGKLRNAVASGSPVIIDFIKSKEEAVPISLSNTRAGICAGCEFNDRNKSLLDMFTTSTSEAIRKTLELARGWNLKTDHDDRLGVCTRCYCPLKFKVHIPMEHISPKVTDEIWERLPNWCWIRREIDFAK